VYTVALGAEHALAMIPMNSDILWGVFGWGKNADGQRATAEPVTTPTWVEGVPVSGDGLRKSEIFPLAAGDYHSIGFTYLGALWGWGDNSRGQLGDGTTVSHGPQASTDRDMLGLVPPPVLVEAARSDHTAPATVTASNPLPGVTIRYAIGLAPSSTSAVFPASGLVLNGPGCVYAQAFKTGMTPSVVKRLCVDFWAPAPTASPGGDVFTAPVDVVLSSLAGTTITYRLDGLDPNQNPSGALTYTGPLHLTTGSQLRARAVKSAWLPSDLLTANYVFNYGDLTVPVLTPLPGTYLGAVDVSITGPTGATIRYTTDGTAPSGTSPIYTGALHSTSNVTIRAASFRSDYFTSEVATGSYSVQLVPPVVQLPSGVYGAGTATTVSHPVSGVEIHYTTDGSDPTLSSPTITSGAAIPLGSFFLKVRAFKIGNVPSTLLAFTYLLPGTVVPPTFTPAAGTYSSQVTVSAATATPGAVIRYTTNGTAPTASSAIFPTAGLMVAQATTLNAAAFLGGVSPSGTTSATYSFMPAGMPTVSPRPGTYIGPLTVFIAPAPPGFVTRYTLDGTNPTDSSPVYDTPLQLTTSGELRAAWFRAGWTPSNVLFANFVLTGSLGYRGYGSVIQPPLIDGAPFDAPPKVWWGDTIRLNTRYLDPVSPKENVLHNGAQSIPATEVIPVLDSTNTFLLGYEARFALPDGTIGNQPLYLTAEGRASGPTDVVMNVGPPLVFRGITTAASGRSTAVRTELPDHVYIADADGIWDVDLYERVPTKSRLIPGNVIIGSKVTASNTFLYVTTDAGRPSIMEFDLTTGATNVYRDLSSLKRDLRIACLAVDFDGSVAYAADRNSGTIIRIPRTGSIGDKIGAAAPYTFGSPCQMDAGGETVVFPSGNSAIQVLTGTGESSLVYTGPEELHSVLVRSAGAAGGYVFSATPWVAWIASANTSTGIRDWVFSPDSADPSYILLGDRQFQRFELTQPQRILVSNDPVDGAAVSFTSPSQVLPRTAKITVNGLPGNEISLRVSDPPDLAAYNDRAATDDNALAFPSSVLGLGTDAISLAWSRCVTVTADESGLATVYLYASSFAGDNYRLEASFADFSPSCDDSSQSFSWSSSPIYTVWKRIFVEHDYMFQAGFFIAADVPANASSIPVAKLAPPPGSTAGYQRAEGLSAGDRIAIIDTDHPFEGPHDEACITAIDPTNSSTPYINVSLGDCMGGAKRLSFAYSSSVSLSSPGGLDFTHGKSAAVGLLRPDPLEPLPIDFVFYRADLGNIQTPFDDGFIEFVAPPSGAGAVPALPLSWFKRYVPDLSASTNAGRDTMYWFHEAWFKHFIAGPADPGLPPSAVSHNYLHLIGATETPLKLLAGLSRARVQGSFVFVQDLQEHLLDVDVLPALSKDDILPMIRNTTEHELAHHWGLNSCRPGGGDHDAATDYVWCNSTGCGRSGPQRIAALMGGQDGSTLNELDRFTQAELLTGEVACASQSTALQHTLRLSTDPR